MTQNFPSHRLPVRTRLAGRLVLLALALAGLFAMHGLGDHGVGHPNPHDASMGCAMVAMSLAENPAAPATSGPPEAGPFNALPEGDSPAMAMAGVCLAALAGALVGLLLLGALRRVGRCRRGAWRDIATTPLTALQERDPPGLFELSIQRC